MKPALSALLLLLTLLLPATLLATGAWLWWRRGQRRAAQARSSLGDSITM